MRKRFLNDLCTNSLWSKGCERFNIRTVINVAGNQTYLLEVVDDHNNTLFVQLSRDGSYWNVNSAGIFKKKYSRRKPEVTTRPALGPGTGTDSSEVDSGQSEGATAPAGKSSQTSESKGSASGGNVLFLLSERASLGGKVTPPASGFEGGVVKVPFGDVLFFITNYFLPFGLGLFWASLFFVFL